MSLDSTTQVDGRATRARRGFRAWRKRRPFWGGLFMMLSGVFLYLTSNLQPGALTIHVGLSGFLSYLLPLMMLLTGALVWASPAQRVFYGVIGMVTAIYSLIGNNLGGFLIGLIFGMLGSGLAAAWVPDKHQPTPVEGGDETVVDEQMGILDPDTEDLDATADVPAPRAGDDDDQAGTPGHATTESEGEQRDRFRGRHSADDGAARFSLNRRGVSRPRLAAVVAFTIAVGTVAAVNVQTAVPARADTTGCTTDQFKKTLTQGGGTKGDGVGDIVEGALGHLGLAAPMPADSPSGDPTPTPSETPTEAPTPTPTETPTEAPTPTPTPTKPKPKPSDTPTEAPTPDPTRTTRPNPPPVPTPTPSDTLCATSAPKVIKAAAGQAVVSSNPSILTTDLLTISGLSFDGIVDLPTTDGTIKVLKFSMSSTTQTPFNLVSDPGAKTLTTTADKLTVSGNVSFFTSELKGNLLGLVPVDFTPDNPPPLVIPELFFTDVTIKLVDIVGDKLTATNMAQIKN